MTTSVQLEDCSRKGDGRYDCVIFAFNQAGNNSWLNNDRVDIMKRITKIVMGVEPDKKKRTTWQVVNPVTHIADTSKKAYKRHPKYGVSDDL